MLTKGKATRSTERRTLRYEAGRCSPDDYAVFIHDPGFVDDWKALKLTDEDLRALEVILMADPRKPPVIPGTGGLRKLRFSAASWSGGKSGGARVLFAWFPAHAVIYLVMAYPKSRRDNITAAEKVGIARILRSIESKLENGNYG